MKASFHWKDTLVPALTDYAAVGNCSRHPSYNYYYIWLRRRSPKTVSYLTSFRWCANSRTFVTFSFLPSTLLTPSQMKPKSFESDGIHIYSGARLKKNPKEKKRRTVFVVVIFSRHPNTKRSNERLFILTRTHSMHIFGEIPFIKPQNDT